MEVICAFYFLIVFFLLVPLLHEAYRFQVRLPLSLLYFMGGVLGLAAVAAVIFGVFGLPGWEGYVLLGILYFSPLWFSVGARRSLEESKGRRASLLRWLNVLGFAVCVGIITVTLYRDLQRQNYGPSLAQAIAAVVALVFSRMVLWCPPTASRWVGLLPAYPAILLMPAVLVVWAMCCFNERGLGISGTTWQAWGIPLIFYTEWNWPDALYRGFRIMPLLVDLLFAVVAAWLLAWAADRLVLRRVRPGRGRQGESGEATRPTAR